MTTVALVPMRHTSERVPGKNYRQLGDRPLFAHIVDTLVSCESIDHVAIDTDSDTIRGLAAERYDADHVILLERPAHLRSGEIPMNDVLLHDVEEVPADLYIQTHSTNPLLRTRTIEAALAAYGSSEEHDSLFSVTRLHTRLYDADGRPLNHDPSQLVRTQDLPPVFEENSNLYIFSADTLRSTGSRIGAKPLLFEIPAEEAWDIDEEIDFRIAEFLWTTKEDK